MSYNKKAVLAANTAAIGLLLRLEKEQRSATEEEQKVGLRVKYTPEIGF